MNLDSGNPAGCRYVYSYFLTYNVFWATPGTYVRTPLTIVGFVSPTFFAPPITAWEPGYTPIELMLDGVADGAYALHAVL